MKPYYEDGQGTIYHGDCREIELSGISAVATDPPYELGFMGKKWDSKGVSFDPETWKIIRGACLSGAPILAFGGSRTSHRIAVAIEDAGWEIRDTLMWVYGSGFPKSLDIGKAIDKAIYTTKTNNPDFQKVRDWVRDKVKAKGLSYRQIDKALGNENSHKASHYLDNSQPQLPTPKDWEIIKGLLELSNEDEIDRPPKLLIETFEREIIGYRKVQRGVAFTSEGPDELAITIPLSPEAQLWEGYGTALKPAYEPIILAMNPLDGTFANNALKHGVAGLNIDECRVGTNKNVPASPSRTSGNSLSGSVDGSLRHETGQENGHNPNIGRFPANFLHDGSQVVMELFPKTTNNWRRDKTSTNGESVFGVGQPLNKHGIDDSGSAARFFYCAKASKRERGEDNGHPTVKPLALMEYLIKLVTYPEYNLIVDPFMGSGTTLLACQKLGIPCIGIDDDERSCEIAAKRLSR